MYHKKSRRGAGHGETIPLMKAAGFFRYYRRFGIEFGTQIYESWKAELRSTLAISAIAFLLSYSYDSSAKAAFTLTMKAALIWLGAWAIYHLVRTPWKLSQKSDPEPRAEAATFKETTHKLAMEMLDFVYARVKEAPPPPSQKLFPYGGDTLSMIREMGERHETQTASNKYESETLGIYNYKYSRQVGAIIKALPTMGISADFLQKYGIAPSNSETIKAIGDHLMQVADLITEPESRDTRATE